MVVGWWWGDSGETGSGGMWLNLRQDRHCWDMVRLGNGQGAEFPAETEKHSNDGMIAAYFSPGMQELNGDRGKIGRVWWWFSLTSRRTLLRKERHISERSCWRTSDGNRGNTRPVNLSFRFRLGLSRSGFMPQC